MLTSLITLALVGSATARISRGICPTVPLQDNFDAGRYVGTWFQVAKDLSSPFENGYCEQQRLSVNPDGTLKVFNTQLDKDTGVIETASGTAVCNGPTCLVKFFWYSPAADYRVVATDYTDIALVYSCSNIYVGKADYVWILSRQQNPSQAAVDQALATLAERIPEYTKDNLFFSYQGENCKYFKDEDVPTAFPY